MSTISIQEMTRLLERLRIQTRFRALKTAMGDDQALAVIEEALRLEFASALETCRPVPDQVGNKKVPVSLQ
jgi:hypothetical protein